jgi:hypothetical protein
MDAVSFNRACDRVGLESGSQVVMTVKPIGFTTKELEASMANKFVVGIVAGVGLKVVAPYVLPVLGALIRPLAQLDVKPLAKAGIKVGWLGLERGRELIAYLGETVQDAMAEARNELVSEAQPPVDKS